MSNCLNFFEWVELDLETVAIFNTQNVATLNSYILNRISLQSTRIDIAVEKSAVQSIQGYWRRVDIVGSGEKKNMMIIRTCQVGFVYLTK